MAAARPANAKPQGVLAKADLQLGSRAFLQWDPNLRAKSEHELENARECLLFCRQFFVEDRTRSVALAQAILFLTILQNSLNYPEDELVDVPWTADYYDKNAEIQALQEKVKECVALKSKAGLERKIDEVESAAFVHCKCHGSHWVRNSPGSAFARLRCLPGRLVRALGVSLCKFGDLVLTLLWPLPLA